MATTRTRCTHRIHSHTYRQTSRLSRYSQPRTEPGQRTRRTASERIVLDARDPRKLALHRLALRTDASLREQWAAQSEEIKVYRDKIENNTGELPQLLDLLLRAEERRAQAQRSYYQALCEYNKSIISIHYWKGSLLDLNSIALEKVLGRKKPTGMQMNWPSNALPDTTSTTATLGLPSSAADKSKPEFQPKATYLPVAPSIATTGHAYTSRR